MKCGLYLKRILLPPPVWLSRAKITFPFKPWPHPSASDARLSRLGRWRQRLNGFTLLKPSWKSSYVKSFVFVMHFLSSLDSPNALSSGWRGGFCPSWLCSSNQLPPIATAATCGPMCSFNGNVAWLTGGVLVNWWSFFEKWLIIWWGFCLYFRYKLLYQGAAHDGLILRALAWNHSGSGKNAFCFKPTEQKRNNILHKTIFVTSNKAWRRHTIHYDRKRPIL